MHKTKLAQIGAWLLGTLVVALAVLTWGQGLSWQLQRLSNYQVFPLLGLIAFSLMWTHYAVGAGRRLLGVDKEAFKNYFEATAAVVLVAILLHPGLLSLQLWADGLGLPPGSILKNYVAPGMAGAVVLGMVALAVFLAFELRHKFAERPWWKYVIYASDLAMLAIFYHALQLGQHLQDGWYRSVWLFYGLSLVAAIVYIRTADRRQSDV